MIDVQKNQKKVEKIARNLLWKDKGPHFHLCDLAQC